MISTLPSLTPIEYTATSERHAPSTASGIFSRLVVSAPSVS
jgi:hypothetical protein